MNGTPVLQIHNVTEIIADLIQTYPGRGDIDAPPFFTRDLLIMGENGQQARITLFANEREYLIIRDRSRGFSAQDGEVMFA